VIIRGMGAIEREVGCAASQGFGGVTVEKIGGGMKGVSPIDGR
jgi:hypothetical protein